MIPIILHVGFLNIFLFHISTVFIAHLLLLFPILARMCLLIWQLWLNPLNKSTSFIIHPKIFSLIVKFSCYLSKETKKSLFSAHVKKSMRWDLINATQSITIKVNSSSNTKQVPSVHKIPHSARVEESCFCIQPSPSFFAKSLFPQLRLVTFQS